MHGDDFIIINYLYDYLNVIVTLIFNNYCYWMYKQF